MMLLLITHVKTTPQRSRIYLYVLVNKFIGMAKRPANPGSTKVKLPAEKRKLLMNEVLKEDQDITAKALEALWKLHHFVGVEVVEGVVILGAIPTKYVGCTPILNQYIYH